MKITALSASCSFDPDFAVVAHVSGGAVELYTRGPDGQISTPERLPEHWQPWGTCASVAAAVAAGNLEPLRQAMHARGEAEQIRRGWRDAPAAPAPDEITLAPAPDLTTCAHMVPVLSTLHISRRDCLELYNGNRDDCTALPSGPGYLVRLPTPADPWPDDAWPDFDGVAVLRHCHRLGYRWIMLDPDGDVIDGIPTFDWT